MDKRIAFYLGDVTFTKLDELNSKCISDLKHPLRELPLKNIIKQNNLSNRRFHLCSGDNNQSRSSDCFVKNRFNSNHSVILRCINFKRHWHHYYNRPPDIPFEQKINTVFWRGTTTGSPDRPGNRFTLVKRWFHNPIMNIGLSHICQGRDEYKPYVKNQCKIEDFLKYRYILSVEGNDKDSGIQWKLNSNSLVMMAKPRITSWLMETTLIPNYHYVLLKDDFSNLEQKIIWYNKNPNICKQIIKNANEYMKQFSNKKMEEEIERKVILQYFKKVE
jgi:hypothetical protein